MKTKKESTMKKLIASLIIAGSAVAIPAQAQHYHHGYRWGGGSWGHGSLYFVLQTFSARRKLVRAVNPSEVNLPARKSVWA